MAENTTFESVLHLYRKCKQDGVWAKIKLETKDGGETITFSSAVSTDGQATWSPPALPAVTPLRTKHSPLTRRERRKVTDWLDLDTSGISSCDTLSNTDNIDDDSSDDETVDTTLNVQETISPTLDVQNDDIRIGRGADEEIESNTSCTSTTICTKNEVEGSEELLDDDVQECTENTIIADTLETDQQTSKSSKMESGAFFNDLFLPVGTWLEANLRQDADLKQMLANKENIIIDLTGQQPVTTVAKCIGYYHLHRVEFQDLRRLQCKFTQTMIAMRIPRTEKFVVSPTVLFMDINIAENRSTL